MLKMTSNAPKNVLYVCPNKRFNRMLNMTSNAPKNVGKHVNLPLHVHEASETKPIQSSDCPNDNMRYESYDVM